jgi:hypothetical protein
MKIAISSEIFMSHSFYCGRFQSGVLHLQGEDSSFLKKFSIHLICATLIWMIFLLTITLTSSTDFAYLTFRDQFNPLKLYSIVQK